MVSAYFQSSEGFGLNHAIYGFRGCIMHDYLFSLLSLQVLLCYGSLYSFVACCVFVETDCGQ